MRFLLPSTTFRAVWGGALLGYIMYDLGHYFLHFGTPFTDYLYKLKVRLDKPNLATYLYP